MTTLLPKSPALRPRAALARCEICGFWLFFVVALFSATLPAFSQDDFGDAPAAYPILLSQDGAHHTILQGFYLGTSATAEADGQPSANASADSGDDGVVFLSQVSSGNTAVIRVFASSAGRLDAWIDWNHDGDWSDQGEQIFNNVQLATGGNQLSFVVPSGSATGTTFARFRLSSIGGLRPTGGARDGEVEDYAVVIGESADLAITATISPTSVTFVHPGQCTVTVVNLGPSPAVNVTISNFLSGVEFLSANAKPATCSIQNDKIACSLSSLAPGASQSVTFGFRPLRAGLLSNVATVASGTFDSNASNNRSTVVVRAAAPLVIVEQPQSRRVSAGSTVGFSVAAKGYGTLRYQWYSNTVAIAGGTNDSLVVAKVKSSADFRLLVSDAFSTIWSDIARLTVVDPPQYLAQPVGGEVMHGERFQFATQSDGTQPIKYQWRLNGGNIPGETQPVHTIESVNRFNAGAYSVIVGNDAGNRVTVPVWLICKDIFRVPLSDDIGSPTPLPPSGVPALSAFGGVIQTDTTDATKQPGEPDHDGRAGSHSVWFQWNAPDNGIVTFDTIGSTFDTLLAVYEKGSITSLRAVESDDDSGGYFRSLLRFNAIDGKTYLIVVDGLNERAGNAVLAWNFEATTRKLPMIIAGPRSQSALINSQVNLSVQDNSSANNPLFYQWFFNRLPLQGATSSNHTIDNLIPKRVGTYTVRIADSAGLFKESRSAIVEIGPVPWIVSQDKVEDFVFNTNAPAGQNFSAFAMSTMSAMTAGGLPPFFSVTVGFPYTQVANNTNSGADIDCFGISTATRWIGFRVTNDVSAIGSVLRVDTAGSEIPTGVALFRFTSPACLQYPDCMAGNLLRCDTNSVGGSYSVVQVSTGPGLQYIAYADGLDGAQGIVNFNWQIGRPPIIDITKSNCTLVAAVSNNVTLLAGVTNAVPAPHYQWYLYGQAVTNATNSTLPFTQVKSSQAGCYSVVASNFAGLVTNECCLIIDPPEIRCQPLWDEIPPVFNVSGALLAGTVVQACSNVTHEIQWQNLVTNATTNCYFQFPAPMYDTNGQSIGPRFYRTNKQLP